MQYGLEDTMPFVIPAAQHIQVVEGTPRKEKVLHEFGFRLYLQVLHGDQSLRKEVENREEIVCQDRIQAPS